MELIETLRATVSDEEDRGVSPVIGVILMVAITVILAAVIATFVLGLGEQVSSTAPQVTVSWEESNTTDFTGDTTNKIEVQATHNGGATLKSENLNVKANPPANNTNVNSDAEITAGDVIGSADDLAEGDTVRIVWTAPNSGTTATLGKYTVQG